MPIKILKSIFIILILFSAYNVLSYDNLSTHPLLTESAAIIYNQHFEDKLTDRQKDWIIKGSINEDTDPRYINHFYDPTTDKGLNGFDKIGNLDIKVSGKSAKQWAKNQDSATGDYSESAILKNYKDGNISRAYQGIGHILHLIQDMAVPAHTRNDPHSGGDPYEKWAEQYGSIDSNKLNFLIVNNLDQIFDEMADYSNNNFLSRDTVDINNIKSYKTAIELVDGKNRMYLLNATDNYLYKFAYSKNPEWIMPVFQVDDDPQLHQDYWNMLYPKAIGYSAGVIDYFIKQFDQIDQSEKEKIGIFSKIKNSLPDLVNEAKYVWGDVYMAQSKVLASGYDNFASLIAKAQDSLQFSYTNIKPISNPASDTPIQITIQYQNQGRVLSASEFASEPVPALSVGRPTLSVGRPTLSVGRPTSAVVASNAVKPAAVPVKKQIAIAAVPVAKQSAPKQALPIKQNPANANNPVKPIESDPAINISEKQPEKTVQTENSQQSQASDIQTDSVSIVSVQDPPQSKTHRKGSDNIPPETTIISYPNSVGSSTHAVFVFVSNENETNFICQFDMNQWRECSAATTTSNLIEGWHLLEVKGIDMAGNTGSSTAISWLVDATAPSSSVSSLNQTYESTGFSVSWSGTDGSASTTSGLAYFDIQYKIDSDGQWQDWIMAATSTQAVFDLPVVNGNIVYFRSRAIDLAGNIENWPENADEDVNAMIQELPETPNPIVLSSSSSALSNWQSSFSWKHTVVGDDPVLVVSLHGDGDYLHDDSVKYGGQTMNFAIKLIRNEPSNNSAIFAYYLADPLQGEHDINVNIGWGLPFAASAATFLNCDTDNPVGAASSFFKSYYDYVQTTPMPDSVGILNSVDTNIEGMMLIDAVTYGKPYDIFISPEQGQTQYFSKSYDPPGGAWFSQLYGNDLYAGQSYKLAGQPGSYSMGWITDDPRSSVHIVIGLNPKP